MSQPTLLLIGGSGFVSGTLARLAVAQGFAVWAVTRGQRELPDGVTPLVGDRKERSAFAELITATGLTWDLAVDCIAYEPDDMQQDIDVLRDRVAHLAFVSTDFVYAPAHRRFPQGEEGVFQSEGYGGRKRACEELLAASDCGTMGWTVVRPCHIYGPGSQLGCLPRHGRDRQLIQRLRAGETLDLVGGGHFLQQPIYAPDLARLLLSIHNRPDVHGQTFVAAGPEIVESWTYYQYVADALDVPLQVNELSVADELAAHPELDNFLCHRIYDLSRLQASGLYVPSTPLADGLAAQVAWLEAGEQR